MTLALVYGTSDLAGICWLGQPDFLSRDVGTVISLCWVLGVQAAVWLTTRNFNPAGKAEKTFLQRVIVKRQPLSQGLEKLQRNLVTWFSTFWFSHDSDFCFRKLEARSLLLVPNNPSVRHLGEKGLPLPEELHGVVRVTCGQCEFASGHVDRAASKERKLKESTREW